MMCASIVGVDGLVHFPNAQQSLAPKLLVHHQLLVLQCSDMLSMTGKWVFRI